MVLSSEYSAPVSNKGHGDVSDTQDGTNKTKTENKSLPDHRYEPPFPAIPLISNDATSQVNSSSNNFLSYHYLHQRLSHKHTEGGPAMDRNDHLNDLSLSDNSHYNSLASHSVEDTARPVKSQPEEESVVFEKAKPRDKTYVEKRKKNNQSAKRSRDTKRQKDELTAMRVLCLEEEHRRLQAELLRLTAEVEEYRFALKSACYQ